MNNIGISTLAFANVVSPFHSTGKTAVGFENAEAKEEVLAPVEQTAASDAPSNRARDASSQDTETNKSNQTDQDIKQQQQQIRALAAREREVIAHEQAHAAVGGQYAGAPSFTYERGPDGVNYAVGGEVPISLPSGGDDPAAVLAAARQVRRAALAPADPSAQDRSVAAQASQIEAQAIADLAALSIEQQNADKADREEARLEASEQQQAEADQQREFQTGEQRDTELEQSARRSVQIGEQLITRDNLQRDQNVGAVVDQLA